MYLSSEVDVGWIDQLAGCTLLLGFCDLLNA
jgi:hypothetical protein